jgi:hypothetical protein
VNKVSGDDFFCFLFQVLAIEYFDLFDLAAVLQLQPSSS